MPTNDSPFEITGHFVEVWDTARHCCLGTMATTAAPGRAYGVRGQEEQTLTAPLEINRGHKQSTVKASPAQPLRIFTRLHPTCGRVLWNHPLNPKQERQAHQ